jgi:hypothetical protein
MLNPTISFLGKRNLVLGLMLVIATIAVYWPAWNGQPVWDDAGHITKPGLRSAEGLARIWTQLGATQQYYPLTHTVLWVEYHIFGDTTSGYHFVNILLHVLSALLLIAIPRSKSIHPACP